MANSSTILGTDGLPISYYGGRVLSLKVVIDTVDTDLDLYDTALDPYAAEEYAAIVGMTYSIAGAHTFTVKSAATTIAQLVRAANQEMREPFGGGILWAGINKGDNIKIASSVAIPVMHVFLAFFKQISVR